MKTIPLKYLGKSIAEMKDTKSIPQEDIERIRAVLAVDGPPLQYLGVLRQIIGNCEGGATVEEIRARGRLLDVLFSTDENAKIIELEDADYKTLSSIVGRSKFSSASRNVREFLADVLGD